MKKITLLTLGLLLFSGVHAQELYKFREIVNGSQRYGFRDAEGNVVIPAKYDQVGDFSDGLAWIQTGGLFRAKYGYIDQHGEEVIPVKYSRAGDFKGGIAKVELDGKACYLYKTGTDIFEGKLTPYVTQMNKYVSDAHNHEVGVFEVSRPYLVIHEQRDAEAPINLLTYSEKIIHAQIIGGLKTLIVVYPKIDHTRTYQHSNMLIAHQRDVTSYGAYIIYFDMDTKECIGYDLVPGPRLPKEIDELRGSRYDANFHDIIKTIEARLATSVE